MEPSILQRVERLEARNQIMRMESRYCQYWDESNGLGWASLFTERGYFERVDLPGRPGHVQRGRHDLRDFCQRLQAGYGRIHMLHTVDIEVHDEDSASSRITFECMVTSTGRFPKSGLVTGYYNTEYSRVNGSWLIAARRERQVFFSESAYYGVTVDEADPGCTEASVG